MGLAFPLMLAGTLFCLFLSLVFLPRRCWIALLGLITTAGSIRSYCPFNLAKDEAPDLTVISYNCHYFEDAKTEEAKRAVLEYFVDSHADICVFQESNKHIPEWEDCCPAFFQRFPHYDCPYEGKTTQQSIFSRYPIERSALVTSHGQNAIVAFWLSLPKGDSLLVVNCHLKSNGLTPEDRVQYTRLVKTPIDAANVGNYENFPKDTKPFSNSDSTFTTSRYLAGKFASTAGIRACMADTLATFLSHHPHIHTLVCGDFNDTPISYSTHCMKRAGLNDAYRMAGNGMGRSFNKDAITVRIDHQFCSDHYLPIDAKIDKSQDGSDHYPLIVKYKTLPRENHSHQ